MGRVISRVTLERVIREKKRDRGIVMFLSSYYCNSFPPFFLQC